MPDMFGPYEVLELVARGSTGQVYRARHRELGRLAALKELAPELRQVPGLMERLRGEAELLSGLSHPNIVDLYDYVEEDARAWLAEEWVDGASLQAILDSQERLTPEQALGVMRGALTGLAYAHDAGVVHRDVSTSNILADQQGTSMLVDFGLAAPAGRGSAIGTPAFLSPEAARGEAVGKPGDVYSAAAVLFTLLSGRTPFAAPDALSMVRAHIDQPAPRLEDHGTDLADLVRRSLSKDPADRPADAGTMLQELEDAARRRHGADWLERASIAGLVGLASAGAGVVAAGIGGGAVVVPAVQTVVFDAAQAGGRLTASAAAAAKPARSLGTKLAVAGGVVATVVVVGVAAYSLSSSDSSPSADPGTVPDGSSSAAAPDPTPTIDPVVDTDPTGVWRLHSSVAKTDNSLFAKAGSKIATVTWKFRPACRQPATCGGVIASSSGRTFHYEWNGRTLTVHPKSPVVVEGLCETPDGTKVPNTHFKEVDRFSDVKLLARGATYVGTERITAKVSQLSGNCTNNYADAGAPAPHATFRWVMTPK